MAILRLRSVDNIRDFTGLPLKDGRIAAETRFLRSGHLAALTERDADFLFGERDVRTVIDLRTDREVGEKPDRIPAGVRYLRIPLLGESAPGITHEKNDGRPPVPDMAELYRVLVTRPFSVNGLKTALHAILESEGGVLWHCAEGKDRCGLVSALFLTAAGADRETILRDYLLTRTVAVPKAIRYYWLILLTRRDPELARAVRKAFSAERAYAEAAFAEMEKRAGSLEAFVRDVLGCAPDGNIL